jgi:DNA-binding response OmpR family regulator
MMVQVLLVEDAHLDQAESLLANLENEGYQVCTTHTPEATIEKTVKLWPNLIVFNAINDLLSLASLRSAIDQTQLKIPYVIVAEKQQLSDGMNLDTIIIAPGKPQQLVQGIKKATSNQKDRFIRLPGLILDTHQHKILREGQAYNLTPKEFKLLHLLVSHHDQILSRKIIMNEVWETDYLGDTRTLDVHIRWIREKIEKNPSRPNRLITIRGAGYRFVLNPE